MSLRTPNGGLRVVRLFPDLLGTYGDDGNAVVLAQRARWRGVDSMIVDVTAESSVPDDGHVYLIGGGEDGPQTRAAEVLAESGALHRAVDGGAAVLAICAGFQLLGASFLGPDNSPTSGLGLLDVVTRRGTGSRIVGEVVVDPDPQLGLAALTGYENHAGVTTLGPAAVPLGTVRSGTGNGVGDGAEGAWQGRIVATYLHGPVLARNPSLADRLLAWALGVAPEALDPLDDQLVDALRDERLAAAAAASSPNGRRRLRATISRRSAGA